MKKLKILHINDFWQGGGAEKVFVETVNAVSNLHDSRYFIAEQRLSGGNLAKTLIFHNQQHRLSELMESYRPDIIHIHNIHNRIGPTVFSAIRSLRKKHQKCKVILTAHDYFLLWPNPSFCYFTSANGFNKFIELPTLTDFVVKRASGKSIFHSIIRKVLWLYTIVWGNAAKEIDLIITPSDFLGAYIKKKWKQTAILTVRNPCEGNFTDGTKSAAKSPTATKLRIIFLGRLSDEKGLLQLLDLLKSNPGIANKIQLDIYGDGVLKNQLLAKIKDSGLSESVFLKGEISSEKKNAIISDYHALVLPSVWYENAPLTIIEAAVGGLRLLTCNYGGMKELAMLCGGDYLFDPRDPVSFAGAVENCIRDTFAATEIKGRNIEKIKHLFSVSTYRENLIQIYTKLIS